MTQFRGKDAFNRIDYQINDDRLAILPVDCESSACWMDLLDIAQHCERFTSPNWWLVCIDCGQRIG